MQYGICHLSVVAVHAIANNTSEMTTQLLYGEHFKILEKQKNWSRIRNAFDNFEGWIRNNQHTYITQEAFQELEKKGSAKIVSDLVSFALSENNNSILTPILIGSTLLETTYLGHVFECGFYTGKKDKSKIIQTALLYLNAPYLWGGRTPFGIDCSGLTQMSYKINGYHLFRSAGQQSLQGDALSFIEESEAGDLAFFDNADGVIDHVGLIMENNYIIHAHGNVRIDRLDHTGIFNTELKKYTHKLRVIKKII